MNKYISKRKIKKSEKMEEGRNGKTITKILKAV